MTRTGVWALLVATLAGAPAWSAVEPSDSADTLPAERSAPASDVWSRATATLRLLGSHRYQRPSLGSLNPDNQALRLPRQTSEVEARLDVGLDLDRVTLSAKPRARWTRDHWQDGPRAGRSEDHADLLLLEGVARLRLAEPLFASFGRENLQWGPGQLLNPSNPFFAENGRENPVREIGGQDFLRVVLLPSSVWTVSWITNTGPGERDPGGRDWHPSHALKADWVGRQASGGALVHGGPDAQTSLRGFGQWTASDALLLCGEASVSRGSAALYPVADLGPLGGHLEATRRDDAAAFVTAAGGAAYTVAFGPTLSLEGVWNGEGYGDGQAERFFDLAHRAGALAEQGLSVPRAAGPSSLGLRLLRRRYLFAQYLQTEIADRLTVTLRWTQNLDDGSALATGFGEWSLSDRWRLFGFGGAGTGGSRDEFGSAVRYSVSLGLELSAF
ncbi:MAG: hypothetical protein HZB55_22645 [Deltaproteobacteria bacterium]|nr:hypothetical protein [Deltaproteobacteria bacterium]